MQCLSVQQPWAWAIVLGPKRIENRTWVTNYRGQLLIHAGKSRERLGDYGPGEPPEAALVFGAILGVVKLVDCVPVAKVKGQPFAEGPWCFILEQPVTFERPVPYRGERGLFDVPVSVIPNGWAIKTNDH